MKMNTNFYEGEYFRFAYPKSWTLRESKGSTENYFQAHIFGEIDEKMKFGPSITVTVYPQDKEIVLTDVQKKVEAKIKKSKQFKDFQLESDESKTILSRFQARELLLSYAVRLPLYQSNARDVSIRERSLFFASPKHYYVVSYKHIGANFLEELSVFKQVLRTLSIETS